MDAAFGSHTSQEDIQELARVQQEVGLTALLEGDAMGRDDEKSHRIIEHIEA